MLKPWQQRSADETVTPSTSAAAIGCLPRGYLLRVDILSCLDPYGRRLVECRTERITSLLDVIVKEEILEKCDNSQYRWVRDKLQEAALALTEKLRESSQLDIGRSLYYSLVKKEVKDELFTFVDLINDRNVFEVGRVY